MTITLVLIIISLLTVAAFLFVAVRGRAAAVNDISELRGKTQPVDLLAFRNLTSPAEEQYLREHLPPRQFRAVQRQRLLAAVAYLNCVSANAAVLFRLGDAARHSSNPQIADAGLTLMNIALRVRLYALPTRLHFYVAYLFPAMQASPTAVSDSYERLAGTVQRLGYLQTGSLSQAKAAVL